MICANSCHIVNSKADNGIQFNGGFMSAKSAVIFNFLVAFSRDFVYIPNAKLRYISGLWSSKASGIRELCVACLYEYK